MANNLQYVIWQTWLSGYIVYCTFSVCTLRVSWFIPWNERGMKKSCFYVPFLSQGMMYIVHTYYIHAQNILDMYIHVHSMYINRTFLEYTCIVLWRNIHAYTYCKCALHISGVYCMYMSRMCTVYPRNILMYITWMCIAFSWNIPYVYTMNVHSIFLEYTCVRTLDILCTYMW